MDWSKIHLPPNFFTKAGIFLAIVVVIVIAVRLVRRSNKIFLSIFCAVGFFLLFFNWIYNRNEPAFLTPIIEPLANSGFFLTKGVERKQADPLGKH
jgi:hypothetical protein